MDTQVLADAPASSMPFPPPAPAVLPRRPALHGAADFVSWTWEMVNAGYDDIGWSADGSRITIKKPDRLASLILPLTPSVAASVEGGYRVVSAGEAPSSLGLVRVPTSLQRAAAGLDPSLSGTRFGKRFSVSVCLDRPPSFLIHSLLCHDSAPSYCLPWT